MCRASTEKDLKSLTFTINTQKIIIDIMKESEIIKAVLKRRNQIREKKQKSGSELNNGYNLTIKAAFDFYRGSEYELTQLLDWLGYEEDE